MSIPLLQSLFLLFLAQEQEIVIVENEAHENQAKTKKEEISQQEGSELATSSTCFSSLFVKQG